MMSMMLVWSVPFTRAVSRNNA